MGTDVIHCQEKERRAERSLSERSRAGGTAQSAETLLRVESPPGAPTKFTSDPKQTEQDVLQTDRVVGLGALLHRQHGQPDQDDRPCPLRHGREGDLPGPGVHPGPRGEGHQGGPREPGDAQAATE